jgi:hypothetical protein
MLLTLKVNRLRNCPSRHWQRYEVVTARGCTALRGSPATLDCRAAAEVERTQGMLFSQRLMLD